MGEATHIALGEQLAAELDRAGRLVEELAVQLCLDPVVFERHAGPLQRFDQVTQILGEIATVLRFEGRRQDALAGIRLDAMRERIETNMRD